METPTISSSPSYNDLMESSSVVPQSNRNETSDSPGFNEGEAHHTTGNNLKPSIATATGTGTAAMSEFSPLLSTPQVPLTSSDKESATLQDTTPTPLTASFCMSQDDSSLSINSNTNNTNTSIDSINKTTAAARRNQARNIPKNYNLSPPCAFLNASIESTSLNTTSSINNNNNNNTLQRPMGSYCKSRKDVNNIATHEPELDLNVNADADADTNVNSNNDEGGNRGNVDNGRGNDSSVEPKTPITEEGMNLNSCNSTSTGTTIATSNVMSHNHNKSVSAARAAADENSFEMQTPPPPPKSTLLPQSHKHNAIRHDAPSSLFLPDDYDECDKTHYTAMNCNNNNFTSSSLSTTTPPLAPIPQPQAITFIEANLSHGQGHDHEDNGGNGGDNGGVSGNKNVSTLSSLQQPHFDSSPPTTKTTFHNSSRSIFHIQRSKPKLGSSSFGAIPPPQKPLRRSTANANTSSSMLYNDVDASFAYPNQTLVSPLLFTSVPLDALHSIAGYLTPQEWHNFGLVSKDALIACREVFKKVKMHGFKCAVEVISSWELGEHSDARELAALYLKSGVPIYPAPYGHEYHTIVWRMKLELDKMNQHSDTTIDARTEVRRSSVNHTRASTTTANHEEENGNNGTDADETDVPFIDRFYPEYFNNPHLNSSQNRRVPRSEIYDSNFTYLEEKGIFWTNEHYKSKGIDPPPSIPSFLLNRSSASSTSSPRQLSSRRNRRFPAPTSHNHFRPGIEFFALFDDEEDLFNLDNIVEQGRIVGISDNVVVEPGNNEHLLHFDFGRRAVQQEEEDRLNRWQRRNMMSATSNYSGVSNDENYGIVKGVKTPVKCHRHLYDQHLQQHKAVYDVKGGMVPSELSLSVDFFHPNEPESHKRNNTLNSGNRIQRVNEDNDFNAEQHSNESEKRVESFWDLHIYSFDTDSNGIKNRTMKHHTKASGSNVNNCREPDSPIYEVVQQYEQRLNYLLERCDYAAFDECILDFWDEFFPITATIHYFDKCSPVPRSSYMRRFLSRPCPEAFGTVQCEIERIKVYNKSKGVNMAGRLFPTYEYRLFIRDRRHHTPFENPSVNEDNQPRMDTILMTAKHKSRNQQSSCGKLSSNRKGVNNYLFYMPQEEDIIRHLDAVNDSVKIDSCRQSEVPGAQFELGRLQSNFIGTEFQIFGPSSSKNCVIDDKSSKNLAENPTPASGNSRKKLSQNKFKLSRRIRRQGNDNETNNNNDHNRNRKGRISPWSSFSKKSVNRDDAVETEQNLVMDKELGAITYTANLLGNRPRVMDVCVPKLSSETGLSIPFESSSENYEEGSILGNLKRLSNQLLHILPQHGRENDEVTADLDNLGLMSLQNRPPWWNVELGAFVLNFGGRVSVASVKNFQLCDRNDHENIMLQFGRIEGRHSFTMDFSYPLSPLQAFAIAVSSLQSKISFA